MHLSPNNQLKIHYKLKNMHLKFKLIIEMQYYVKYYNKLIFLKN